MKKIGFLAVHPGSTNSLNPIINQLRINNVHDIYLYPLSDYARNLWGGKEHFTVESFSLDEHIRKDLDILFYSAQSNFKVELDIPAFCKKHNIKSVSITDVINITKSQVISRYSELPDYIVASTEELYTDLCNDNLNDCIILPFGNPHIENFIRENKIKSAPLNSNELVLSFISAPSSNELSSPTAKCSENIINELASYCRTHNNIKKIYLCNHPREDLTFFQYFLTANADIAHLFEANPFTDTTEACANSDIVIGDNSTVLYEQALIGKRVIFHTDEARLFSSLESPDAIRKKHFVLPPDPLAHILSYFEINQSK